MVTSKYWMPTRYKSVQYCQDKGKKASWMRDETFLLITITASIGGFSLTHTRCVSIQGLHPLDGGSVCGLCRPWRPKWNETVCSVLFSWVDAWNSIVGPLKNGSSLKCNESWDRLGWEGSTCWSLCFHEMRGCLCRLLWRSLSKWGSLVAPLPSVFRCSPWIETQLVCTDSEWGHTGVETFTSLISRNI